MACAIAKRDQPLPLCIFEVFSVYFRTKYAWAALFFVVTQRGLSR